MFNFFKKKPKDDGTKIAAAVDGQLMPITDVKDDVFSTKMLGDGYAIKPASDDVYAPVSGKISTLFPTKHAVGITTDQGLEVLVHLGLDTVELKGEPFEAAIQEGQTVNQGDKIITMNRALIVDKGYDDSVIVVYTNMDLLNSVSAVAAKTVAHGDEIQTIEYK